VVRPGSPGWWHVPVVTSVTVAPLVPPVVQTEPVVEEKVTVRREVAVALTVTGEALMATLASVPKLMVWVPRLTVKLCWTCGAAA